MDYAGLHLIGINMN